MTRDISVLHKKYFLHQFRRNFKKIIQCFINSLLVSMANKYSIKPDSADNKQNSHI